MGDSLQTLWAFSKLVLWSVILFVWLARKIFSAPEDEEPPSLLTTIAYQIFTGLIVIHGLLLLGILDTFSILVSFGAIFVGRVWFKKRISPRELGDALLLWVHDAVYNLLDSKRKMSELASSARGNARAKMNGWSQRSGLKWWQAATLACVIVWAIAPRMMRLIAFPYPTNSSEYFHVLRLKKLTANQFSTDTWYNDGTHMLGALLRTVTFIDEMQLWKMIGILLALMTGALVYGVVAGARSDRFLGGIVGCATAIGLVYSPLLQGSTPQEDLHPWHLGALLFLIGAHAVGQNFRGTHGRGLIFVCSASLALVHTLAWGVWIVAMIALGCWAVVRWKASATKTATTLGVALASSLALVASMSGLVILREGKWNSQLWFTEVWGAIPSGEVDVWASAGMVLTAGLVASLILAIWPASKEKIIEGEHLAIAFLGGWTLAILPALGIPSAIPIEGLKTLLVPISAAVIGGALEQLRHELVSPSLTKNRFVYVGTDLIAVCAIAGVMVVHPPEWTLADDVEERLPLLTAATKVRQEYLAGTWTLIGPDELAHHVIGEGWHINIPRFLETYDPTTYRWDPRTPDTSIPTPHTFIMVRLDRQDDKERALDRQVAQWCDSYMATGQELTVAYEDAMVRLYHLERKRDKENRILDQLWEERNKPPS